MPENLDPSSLTPNPTTPETPDANPSAEVEEVAAETPAAEPAEKYVPLSELLDERHARQAAQAQLNNLTQQQILLQQQILSIKQEANPTGKKVDPEVMELLKPYLEPYEQQLRAVQQQAEQAKSELEAQRNVAYVREQVPAFDELGPVVAKEIQKMPAATQDAILSNPDLLIRFFKAVELENKTTRAAAVKQVARAAGRTETGSASVAAAADTTGAAKDWLSMSSDEFNSNPLVRQMFD